ncbi:glutathione S-transferase family protein [Methylobacterium sp. NMS14P]|uniref:glutathione S-transferase family protein n=1 Tax=Methylobacterium sp. NMS14P TaxID=2894310 RepID=UPI002359BEAB|nr:glutathione S-transferase family protein [Methylobacterium sp. NMS14P]WCS23902.1 glutathione S-transferase family protein [Methylobacterium sp. NMS14P]
MITLYHAPQSRSSRIVWLLEELGVPYTIAPVSIFRPMTGEGVPDDANPHPDKRVPAVQHAGALIAESQAIVLYLSETFPEAGLAPAVGAPERGAYLTWLAWYVAEFEPALFAGLTGELAGSPQKRRNHEAVVRRLEDALARGPYVMGERFSGADILIGSALGFGRAAFPASAALDAYLERCRARPAALRAAAKDGASGPQSA